MAGGASQKNKVMNGNQQIQESDFPKLQDLTPKVK